MEACVPVQPLGHHFSVRSARGWGGEIDADEEPAVDGVDGVESADGEVDGLGGVGAEDYSPLQLLSDPGEFGLLALGLPHERQVVLCWWERDPYLDAAAHWRRDAVC